MTRHPVPRRPFDDAAPGDADDRALIGTAAALVEHVSADTLLETGGRHLSESSDCLSCSIPGILIDSCTTHPGFAGLKPIFSEQDQNAAGS